MIFPGNHDVLICFANGAELICHVHSMDWQLVGGWALPLWKMMEWESMGRMPSHIWNGQKTCLKPPSKFSCTRLLNGFPWFSHIFWLVVEPPPLKHMLTSELASSQIGLLTTHPGPSISTHKNTSVLVLQLFGLWKVYNWNHLLQLTKHEVTLGHPPPSSGAHETSGENILIIFNIPSGSD